MSSLRDLLDVATTDGIPVATYYGPQNAHQIWWRGDNCWNYSSNHDYAHQQMTWCVPSCCVCKVVFEVWAAVEAAAVLAAVCLVSLHTLVNIIK